MNSWMSQLSDDTKLSMLWTKFDFHIKLTFHETATTIIGAFWALLFWTYYGSRALVKDDGVFIKFFDVQCPIIEVNIQIYFAIYFFTCIDISIYL